ncbi:HPF/RaiA family ribosome-associated protein [Candidatus Dependentiae bacterium]|nr:HPF/RaiA family ribosome-associated protein [Candidatus Dependentiae bacterium]
METKITFRNMEHSDPMEKHAQQQLEKVKTFLENEPTPVRIDLILEPSKVHSHHRIELRVKSPHYDVISNYEGSEFYKVLDRVIDIMYKRLHEEKRKRIDARKGIGRAENFKKNS